MYGEKSINELLELLERHEVLTFESQLQLNAELEKRNLIAEKKVLDQTIAQKINEIKNLEYLKDFGFKAEINDGGVLITRTLKAMITDIIAVIAGLIVFLIGIYGIASLVSVFVNGEEINVFSLAINFVMASLVLTGFKFFNGIKRLFDYSGFELSNLKGVITLRKRFDLKLEQIREKASELLLETEENQMVLKLGNHTIFSSSVESIVQRLTLEELANVLRKE
ncbi:MAG: hypothetical protein WBB27_16930 [Maribacter sp.]